METIIIKNQTINVRKTIIGWMTKNENDALAIINGIGKQERHTANRLNNIMNAYNTGTENELPAIQVAPQYGEVIDGRHRLAVAYLLGIDSIRADLHYNV